MVEHTITTLSPSGRGQARDFSSKHLPEHAAICSACLSLEGSPQLSPRRYLIPAADATGRRDGGVTYAPRTAAITASGC